MGTITGLVLSYSLYLPTYLSTSIYLPTSIHLRSTNSLTFCVKLYAMCICAFSGEQVCDFHYYLTGVYDSKVVKNYSIKAIPDI